MKSPQVIVSLVLLLAAACGDDGGDTPGVDGGPSVDGAMADMGGPVPSCSDGIQNQDESDVDCGGVCGATCQPGDMCGADGDCTTDDCDGTCQPLASCEDGDQNGMETDVDCGGPMCMGCAEGEMCTEDDDCAEGACAGGVCSPTFTIGGTVTGVVGAGMVLQNDGGDDLAISADGTFTFATPVAAGADYAVTVLSGPGTPELPCTVTRGRGTVSAAVTDVAVDCVTFPDDIADAVGLTEGVEVRFTSVGTTLETDEVVCDEGGTVWFTFTAAEAGDYTAYATGSDHDTEITWSESLTGPTEECNDDADDSYDAIDAQLTFAVDDQRFVQIGLHDTEYRGTGGVGVARVVPAADDFAEAVALTLRAGAPTAVQGISFAGTEGLETDEPVACGSETLADASAWVEFTPPTSGTWMIEAKSSDEMDVAVYSGTAVAATTLLNCVTQDKKSLLVDLTAGESYRIRVGDVDAGGRHAVVRAERVVTPLTASVVDEDGDGDSGNVGSHSDMVILGGEPAVAYFDSDNGELRFAQRSGGTWTDELIDGDGDGTSTQVGQWVSLALLDSGEPAVSYFDSTNGELRYAERSGGSWTDVLVDGDGDGTSTRVGEYSSLVVLSDGNPAIAYFDRTAEELRYAERASGTWSDVLVDADGEGTSTNVGRYPSLIELPTGPAISYVDMSNSELRLARRESGTWSEESVYVDPEGHSLRGASAALDSSGNLIVAATDTSQANHMIARRSGGSWSIEWDFADRNTAELDFDCSTPRLLVDASDRVMLFWTDCNYSGTMAISVREPDGTWSVRPVTSQHADPNDALYEGSIGVWNTESFGIGMLPSGELLVSFQDSYMSSLWVAEGN